MKKGVVVASACALLLSVVVSGRVEAKPPKHTKKEAVIEAAKQTALTKPAKKKVELKKRPTIEASDVFAGVGEQLKAVTDSQIKVLQRLIDNTNDDDPEKPDYLFRMAELYAEQEHYYNFRARELDQKIYDAEEKKKPKLSAKLKQRQKNYEKREKQWLRAAVKEYLKVVKNPKFNNYKRMDQVLFYLAFLLTQQKREDLARPIFKRLIKDYPQSQFIPDAYLSFAEYFFEDKRFEAALKFYDKVLQFPRSRVYGYAHYKKGWVYLNLQDYKKALNIFVAVIKETQSSKNKGRIQLLKEAKKDSVRCFAHVGTPEKAWNFFKRIGGDYAPKMLEALGELYNSMGMFKKSVKIYRNLIQINPKSTKICEWQSEVLRNTLSITGSRATKMSVNELQRLAAVWQVYPKMKGVKKSQVDECRVNTAGSLRELATTWHKEAQKTNNNSTYDLAQYLYREYIKLFPKERDIYAMTFYYSELLFKLEKYCDAAPVYTSVVKLKTKGKAKYRDEAAYAAVISWKNCLAVDDTKGLSRSERKGVVTDSRKASRRGKKRRGKKKKTKKQLEAEAAAKLKPIKIPERWQKMLDAFDTYIAYVPKSKELPTIRYRKARLYYEYNHFDKAAKYFGEVVEHHRKSKLAVFSVNLLFDSYNVLHQVDKLETATRKYCKWPELRVDQAFVEQCDLILANLDRMKIEALQKTGQHLAAAALYEKLAKEHPDDPKIDEVMYNAAVEYEKGKAIGMGIKIRTKLIKDKPDSILAKRSVFYLGRAFQNIAAYGNAAGYYEKFASKYPGEKAPTDAATALHTATFFRRGLGENEKAIKNTEFFIKTFGTRKKYVDRSAGSYFGLGRIYENNRERLKKHLATYLKRFGSKGGIDRRIVANVKLGEMMWRDSCPVKGVNGACVTVKRVRASSATRIEERAKKRRRGKKGKRRRSRRKKREPLPAQCGPATKTKVVLHKRNPKKAKMAMKYFATAIKLFGNGKALKKVPGEDKAERESRSQTMTYAVAQAKMMKGDMQYEKLLTIQIPRKLDFTPVDPYSKPRKQKKDKKRLAAAQKKFKDWLTGKSKQVGITQKAYQDVLKLKQAHWSIAAAARIGQLFQDFSGQLYTAPVPKAGPAPKGMKQHDFEQLFHDAYCDAMVDTAEPLEKKAIQGLSACLNTSTSLSWFNEWSALCEAELNQIKPAEYPLAAEIRGQPGYFNPSSDPAPLMTELN